MPEPRVSENMQQEMSNLMQDYSSYNEEQNLKLTVDNELDTEETKELNDIDEVTDLNEDKYDSISEELKREIENLEKRDSSSENLDDSENGLEVEVEVENEVNNGVLDLELEEELNEENIEC